MVTNNNDKSYQGVFLWNFFKSSRGIKGFGRRYYQRNILNSSNSKQEVKLWNNSRKIFFFLDKTKKLL